MFFVKNLYYPEFINNILNIRDYLHYYMITNDMLENGFCVSHYFINKINKFYFVKIFIYQIDLEKSSYEYINEIFVCYYKILKQLTFINYKNKKVDKNIKCKKYISYLHNADLFVYFYLFFLFFSKQENIEKDKDFINFLNENKYNKDKKILNYKNNIFRKFLNLLIFRLKNICLEDKKILKDYDYKEDFNNKKFIALKVFLFKKKKEYFQILNKLYLKKEKVIDAFIFKNKKIFLSDLFFFFAKKVNFKKFKSMYLLDVK
jgi:hypothetical protein